MFKKKSIFIILIGLSFASLPIVYNSYVNRTNINKYGLFAPSNCIELEKWYPKTIDNLLVREVVENKYRKGVGKMIVLENNSEILFGRVSYPSELIVKGDFLYKSENTFILYIKRGEKNISWDIRELYSCEQFTSSPRSGIPE